MREIRFRGKAISQHIGLCEIGQWVYGSLVKDPDGVLYIHEWEMGLRIDIDPYTVGQYMNLKDKNHTDIYEDDILTYDNSSYNVYSSPKTGVVSKMSHREGIKVESGLNQHGEMCYHLFCFGNDDFFGRKSIVLGNIHDNPQMIK